MPTLAEFNKWFYRDCAEITVPLLYNVELGSKKNPISSLIIGGSTRRVLWKKLENGESLLYSLVSLIISLGVNSRP